MYNDYDDENRGSPPEDLDVSDEPSDTRPETPKEDSEYSITREQGSEYSFWRYEAEEEAAQKNYRDETPNTPLPEEAPKYTWSEPEASRPVKREKKKGRLIALILLILILGGGAGAAGGIISYNYLSGQTGTGAPPDINYAPEQESESTDNPASASSALSGAYITGQEVYALGCQQVVGINVEMTAAGTLGQESGGVVSGAGIIITEDGYILTNYHVVEAAVTGGYDITVMFNDGTTYTAAFVGHESDESDVAVIKIDAAGLNAATIGDSNKMVVGETIYAIGNPLGELTYTVTSGIVSAMDRAITFTDSETGATDTTINMFQIDAAVNAGNSGGPVYNGKGEVIGIVTAKYDSAYTDYGTTIEGIGFAIPINDAIDIAVDLIEYGYVAGKPSFGIEVRTISSAEAEYYSLVVGAYVATVYEDSAADKAGIQVGDIITQLGDTEITSFSDLSSAKKDYSAGDTAKITVYRKGEYMELELTFDEATSVSYSGGSGGDMDSDTSPDSDSPWG